MQRRAPEAGPSRLPVGELPDNFDGVPLDGEQYLAIVRCVGEWVRADSTDRRPALIPESSLMRRAPLRGCEQHQLL